MVEGLAEGKFLIIALYQESFAKVDMILLFLLVGGQQMRQSLYRGTSLIRKCPSPEEPIGP